MVPRVIPFLTGRGRPVPNQYMIVIGNTAYFQSYVTIVAMRKDTIIGINSKARLSNTTLRYLAQFLHEPGQGLTQRIRDNLANGVWIDISTFV